MRLVGTICFLLAPVGGFSTLRHQPPALPLPVASGTCEGEWPTPRIQAPPAVHRSRLPCALNAPRSPANSLAAAARASLTAVLLRLRTGLIVALCALTLGSSATHASVALAEPAPEPPQVVLQQQARAPTVRLTDVSRPSHSQRISDGASLLGHEHRRLLNDQIRATEARTGSDILLVTLPTIGGEDQERFTRELFNLWSVGSDTANHKGVLVLFVKDGGKRGRGRIEVAVSRSLNRAVGHGWTNQMLESSVLPRLREHDFAAGFAACIERLEPRLVFKAGDRSGKASTAETAFGILAAASGGAFIWNADRRGRTCDTCGAICERAKCSRWEVVEAATDMRAGLQRRAVRCHKCGATSYKMKMIRRYDGRRQRSDGTWDYYYDSDSSDGGGSDGGGGGGGDC